MRSPRDRSLSHVDRLMRQAIERHDRQLQQRAVAVVAEWRKTYSLREVALVLGVSRMTISRWETGETMPNVETAQDLVNRADLYLRRLNHNKEVS